MCQASSHPSSQQVIVLTFSSASSETCWMPSPPSLSPPPPPPPLPPPPVSLPTCSSTSSNSSVIHLLRNNWWTGECRVGQFPTMRERMEGEEEEDGESSSVSNAGRIRDSTRISEESPEIRLKWAWESKSRRDEDHRS